MVNYVFQ